MNDAIPTPTNVTRLLRSLGDTPSVVATVLINHSITGSSHRAQECPVAKFLKRQFPAYTFVVCQEWVCVTRWPVVFNGRTFKSFKVDTTPSVKTFIKSFDRGYYPNLHA